MSQQNPAPNPSRSEYLTATFMGLAVSGVFLCGLFWDTPSLGHDYYHQFVHFLVGKIHFHQNGLSLPHFTPSLCGGIPYFADPQNTYFSLGQWLNFYLPPLPSLYITYFIFALIGFWGIYQWLGLFKFLPICRILGGSLFVLNGFSFAHLWVGHYTHHTFFLIPWGLFILMQPKKTRSKQWQGAGAFGIFASYMVYSGSIHMIAVFCVTVLGFLPQLLRTQSKQFLIQCFFMVGLTCSSKLLLGNYYAKSFHIYALHLSDTPMLLQWFRYFWPYGVENFEPFGQLQMGAWEYVGFSSILVIPALIYFIWKKRQDLKPRHVLFALPWILIGLAATGQTLNAYLPGLDSYHNPIKLLASFHFVYIWIFTWGLNTLAPKAPPRLVQVCFVALCLFIVAEYASQIQFFRGSQLGLGFPYQANAFALPRSKKLPEVSRIINSVHSDIVAIQTGASSLKCSEPVFGYRWESAQYKITPGPTEGTDAAFFNLQHPGCFVFGDFFGCKPWQRIKREEAPAFIKFRHGEADVWGLPIFHQLLQWLNSLGILTALGLSLGKAKK